MGSGRGGLSNGRLTNRTGPTLCLHHSADTSLIKDQVSTEIARAANMSDLKPGLLEGHDEPLLKLPSRHEIDGGHASSSQALTLGGAPVAG